MMIQVHRAKLTVKQGTTVVGAEYSTTTELFNPSYIARIEKDYQFNGAFIIFHNNHQWHVKETVEELAAAIAQAMNRSDYA